MPSRKPAKKNKKSASVLACTRCGSWNLESMVSGCKDFPMPFGTAPHNGYQLCRHCGYFGLPIICDSEEIRKKYEMKKSKGGFFQQP
jgi:hypothetical protein